MIKNILFDLGGVIININYQLTIDALQKLASRHVGDYYKGLHGGSFFDEFERGHISAAQFRNELRDKLEIVATDAELDKAWNAMLLDLPQCRLDFIKSLHGKFTTFLFSNTNEIHYAAIQKICEGNGGFEAFENCFEKDYYSFKVGARKPDVEAYYKVLAASGLKADETLFVDDNLQNVEGARLAGMCAMHLKPDMSILEVELLA